jgi:hypothetical protein
MIEAIIIIAILASGMIAIRHFGLAEKICDKMIARSERMIRTLKIVKQDLKRLDQNKTKKGKR